LDLTNFTGVPKGILLTGSDIVGTDTLDTANVASILGACDDSLNQNGIWSGTQDAGNQAMHNLDASNIYHTLDAGNGADRHIASVTEMSETRIRLNFSTVDSDAVDFGHLIITEAPGGVAAAMMQQIV